jgi:hypothetical protein
MRERNASRGSMSTSDQIVLDVFRAYQIMPGQMLCFHGVNLEKHQESLRRLASKGLLAKERFAGGYSLTSAGFAAMQERRDDRHDSAE